MLVAASLRCVVCIEVRCYSEQESATATLSLQTKVSSLKESIPIAAITAQGAASDNTIQPNVAVCGASHIQIARDLILTLIGLVRSLIPAVLRCLSTPSVQGRRL